jgi:uncharacterized delta-60 repeat protein
LLLPPDFAKKEIFDQLTFEWQCWFSGFVIISNNTIQMRQKFTPIQCKWLVATVVALQFSYHTMGQQAGTLDAGFATNGIGAYQIGSNLANGGAEAVAVQADQKIILVGSPNISGVITRRNTTGEPDATFANAGYLFFSDIEFSDVALQSDGKILACGKIITSTDDQFFIVRLNSNGTFDNTFSGDGKLNIVTGVGDARAYKIGIQQDGKLLVSGFSRVNGTTSGTLIRLNANGTLDNGFGNAGIAVFTQPGITSFFYSLAIEADGKIVTAGYYGNANAIVRWNADGTIDTGFDTDGLFTFKITDPGFDEIINDIVIQSDGKYVLTSEVVQGIVTTALVRLNTDLSFDATFSGDGIVNTDAEDLTAVKILVDDKIVVAGGSGDYRAFRFNSDGSPDNTFDGDGLLILSGGYGAQTFDDLALAADGNIVFAGVGAINFSRQYVFSRIKPDGTADLNAGGDGLVVATITGSNDVSRDIAVLPDGKILLGGYTNSTSNTNLFALLKLNANGSVDNSFNGDGKYTHEFAGNNAFANSIALQTDGKIVLAGYVSSIGNDRFAVLRLNANGDPDNSFDGDGQLILDVQGQVRKAIIQPDGKIILVGTSNGKATVARLNADGTPDNSFGINGVATVNTTASSSGTSVALQTDGKIVVAGSDFSLSNSQALVARFNVDGSPDNSFNGDGILTSLLNSNSTAVNGVAIQSDGKIVIGGYAAATFGSATFDFMFARINSDGSFDNSFGTEGITKFDYGNNSYDNLYDIEIQPDGKIVGGGTSRIASEEYAVVRVLANCTPDPSFNGNGRASLVVTQNFSEESRAIAIQSDGKILLTGDGYGFAPGRKFFAARFNGASPALTKVSILPSLVNEGNSGTNKMIFILKLHKKLNVPVTVSYTTVNGSAVAGQDYVAKSGTVTFPANTLLNAIEVSVKGDLVNESNETFKVLLSNPINASLENTDATGVIVNDDFGTAKVFDASAAERDGQVRVRVTLSLTSDQTVRLRYSTENGSAKSPDDYTGVSNQWLEFNPGETEKFITIVLKQDNRNESTEKFYVKLTGADNANILAILGARPTATVSITNSNNNNHRSISETDTTTDVARTIAPIKVPTLLRKSQQLFITGLNGQPNELVITGSNGAIIKKMTQYNNNWTPGNISQGIYFYNLRVKNEDGTFKSYSGKILITD